MKCNLCGADVKSCKGWLERVNAKGVPGIYECRPICGADLPPPERIAGAIDGDAKKVEGYNWMPEARVGAAACWQQETTKHIPMDSALAEAVAERIAGWMKVGTFHASNEFYWRERAKKAERDLAAAQAERDALLRIKEVADVLYSEAEEYDLPDGLGMGASQEYWDDLANALFPDDSGAVIQADLEKVQTAVDRAWEAFNEEINKPEFLPCGHHHSLMLKSAETGDPLYCELCDCISRRNDAEKMEAEARAAWSYATTLAVSMHRQHYAEDSPNWQPLTDLVGLLTQIDNMYAGLRNDLEALKVENKRLVGLPLATLMAERDALRAAWETAKRQNSHDMLLSGDEIHQHNEAIWIAGGRK